MSDFIRLERLTICSGQTTLVDTTGFTLRPGALHVLVGASGSGKTLTARSLLGLVGARPGVTHADLLFSVEGNETRPYAGQPDTREVHRRFKPLRGDVIGYLPQDARASLNPVWRVGGQVSRACKLRGVDPNPYPWLSRSGFADPSAVAQLFPHQLSGGMAQRASIALALARGSRFLVADEPTTGLDPTIQAQLLEEMVQLKGRGVGILFITHDLRIVPQIADHLMVMHEGRLVENGPNTQLKDLDSEPARRLWRATSRISGGLE
ncbi:MAG: ATP-binding cassette domain-containing protein [Myxococcota bacterium]|nr:ATP-binding cassette domain-containing protein [Myxococcota bacterium]